jgi:hypothetical protein
MQGRFFGILLSSGSEGLTAVSGMNEIGGFLRIVRLNHEL